MQGMHALSYNLHKLRESIKRGARLHRIYLNNSAHCWLPRVLCGLCDRQVHVQILPTFARDCWFVSNQRGLLEHHKYHKRIKYNFNLPLLLWDMRLSWRALLDVQPRTPLPRQLTEHYGALSMPSGLLRKWDRNLNLQQVWCHLRNLLRNSIELFGLRWIRAQGAELSMPVLLCRKHVRHQYPDLLSVCRESESRKWLPMPGWSIRRSK